MEPAIFTLDEVQRLVRGAEAFLEPHRQWGECPMTGAEQCCDTLVRELRCLRRTLATLTAIEAERASAIEAMVKTLHESSSDYEAALDSVRSELRLLRDDKERIDWHEGHPLRVSLAMGAIGSDNRWAYVGTDGVVHVTASLREALDAARGSLVETTNHE